MPTPLMTKRHTWWLAIRPKTLSAAFAPVAIGTALAARDGSLQPWAALAALGGAVAIQIGTNLANDLFDFRRGADTAERLGPTRVTQAGLLSPSDVAWGTAAAFVLAVLFGIYLVAIAGWPILILGLVSVLAGILYTAGPYPLAYLGLGDVFVMAFFGIAAVTGTYFVQSQRLSSTAVWLGVAIGALAVTILAVNNLRDIDTDGLANKRTLAVRLGAPAMRWYYALLVGLAFAIPAWLVISRTLAPSALISLLAAPLAVQPVRAVLEGTSGRALNPILGQTARLQMAYTFLLVIGLWLA